MEKLNINGLDVNLIRKPNKNMYLRVKRSGEIEITAPYRMEEDMIKAFVLQKWDWIQSKQATILKSLKHGPLANEIYYFGQLLKVETIPSSKQEIKVVEDRLLHLTRKQEGDEMAIKNWMFLQLQEKINTYMKKYWPIFAKQGIAPVEVKYRLMKSTWGVCRPTRGVITFNKHLIHQPEEFIEYVVVHELSHLIVANHSKAFYRVVESLLPQWKVYEEKRIKNYSTE